MDLFTACLDFGYLAALSVLHLDFVGRLTGKRTKLRQFGLYCALLWGFQIVLPQMEWGDLLAIGAEVLALYAVARCGLKAGRAGGWTAAVIAVYVSQLSFGVVNALEAMWAPPTARRALIFAVMALAVLTALAICAGCCRVILKCLPPDGESVFMDFLLLPTLFFFFAQFYIMRTSYSVFTFSMPVERGKHMALLLLQALGLGALLCTLYACRRVRQGFKDQAALASLAQAVQAQKVYTGQARLRYERTRAFRHDLKNHLTVLEGLIRSGRPEAATAYLQKMEAASQALSFPCRTGEAAVDVLLEEKLEAAAVCGIETEVTLPLPEGCGVDPFDLCVILSNALDNAIAACRAAGGENYIRVSGKRRGGLYMLAVENTCRPGPMPPEGTGLSNIRSSAEKYHGAVSAEKEGDWFRLHVLLNIS